MHNYMQPLLTMSNNNDDQDDTSRPALTTTPSISYVKRIKLQFQRIKKQEQPHQFPQQQQQEPAQQQQQTRQNDNDNNAGNNKNAIMLFLYNHPVMLFLSSSLGWTPDLYNKIKNGEWSLAILYCFAFIVDLADAVFDLILSFQTLYRGDDGGKGLGILLGVMTILGRFITGLYGGYAKRNTRDDDEEYVLYNLFSEEFKAVAYLLMELTVFLLEDGAAILLLAKTTNSSSSLDVLQTISLCLTLICAGAFILLFYGLLWVHFIRKAGYCKPFKSCIVPSVYLAVISFAVFAFPTFMIWILIQEVLVKGEDDPPFSGGLELASYIIYGVGAFIGGLFSIWNFIFCGN